MLKKIDKGNGTDYMETIEQQAKLTEKHEMIIKTTPIPIPIDTSRKSFNNTHIFYCGADMRMI